MRVAPCAPTHASAATTSRAPSTSTTSGYGPPMPTQTLSRAEQIRIDDAAWGNSSSRQDSGVTRKRVIIDTTQQKQQKRSAMERDARIDARQSNANYPACNNFGNDVWSCYPTATTIVPQEQWSKFIWNKRQAQLIGAGSLDIYLRHSDSGVFVDTWKDIANSQGFVNFRVNDSMWDDRALSIQSGQTQDFPFNFIIATHGRALTGDEPPQATFTARQTSLPTAVLASSSAAAESSKVAASGGVNGTGASGPRATLQGASGLNGGFPHWAIALLVILGFLAILALILLSYLLIRSVRNRSRLARSRNSMGSESPMMEGVRGAGGAHYSHSLTSPVTQTDGGHNSIFAVAGAQAPLLPLSIPGSSIARPASLRHPNPVFSDGASTRSDGGPFSGADAAIMADAFRQALRKPDFAHRPVEEGDTPESNDKDPNGDQQLVDINRELAEEGRDIRSVSSGRGVRVESHLAQPSSRA